MKITFKNSKSRTIVLEVKLDDYGVDDLDSIVYTEEYEAGI